MIPTWEAQARGHLILLPLGHINLDRQSQGEHNLSDSSWMVSTLVIRILMSLNRVLWHAPGVKTGAHLLNAYNMASHISKHRQECVQPLRAMLGSSPAGIEGEKVEVIPLSDRNTYVPSPPPALCYALPFSRMWCC